MKTISVSPEDMEARIARFQNLKPIAAMQNDKIPLEARDHIYARKLLPVISSKGGEGPFGPAPIAEADGYSMTLAVCPPNQGPGLHAHHKTHEIFTCLKGTFKIQWGDDGTHAIVLNQFDTISVPPGVCRSFTNIGDDEGFLQVLITGGVHDMQDIAFPPSVAEQIDQTGPGVLAEIKKTGLAFNAGQE